MRSKVILLSLVGGIFVLKGYDTYRQLTHEEKTGLRESSIALMQRTEALAQSVVDKLDAHELPLTQRVMSVPPAHTVIYKDRVKVVYKYKTKIVRRVEMVKAPEVCHRLKLRNKDGSGWNVKFGCNE